MRDDPLVVSFMAGFALARPPIGGAGLRLTRVMPSAPFTIAQRKGIAGVFPAGQPVVRELCDALGLASSPRLAAEHGLPDYPRILAWAHGVRPRGLQRAALTAFPASATTRGGVTASILETIAAGELPPARPRGGRAPQPPTPR
jgi:hypothetical protein